MMKQNRFLQMAFFATAVLLATGIASAQTPTLTHYLPFDGDLSDTAGGLYGNSLWSYVDVYQAGISGNAAYFNGGDTIVLLEGEDVLPTSGGFTVTFWEYADTTDPAPDGYFFADAGWSPLENLYLRRFMDLDPADPENSEISALNGRIAENFFGKYNPVSLPTGQWINHTITTNDAGQSFWYVNGQLSSFTYQNNLWEGLTTPDGTNSTYAGLTIGNRIDGNRTYQGYLDEFQVYDGYVDGGMASYLYDNPGSTLATYDSGTYPDPGLPDLFPDPTSVQQWTFDTDLSEANGGTAGTAIGNAAIQATAGVDGNGALYFDGDDDAVSIDGSVIPTTGSISISFWSKTDGETDGYMICDGEDPNNLFMRRRNTDYFNGTVAYDTKDNHSDFGPYDIDTWHHHVLVSCEETGQNIWFVDGELASINRPRAEEEAIGILHGLVSDLYLGNRTDLARDFTGWIDDLQIYDGTLTPDQVAYLFANPGETLLESPKIAGDANGDGKVDGSDVTILANNWQAGVAVGGDPENVTWEMGDFNSDGMVDGSDVTILANNWQYGVTTAAATVPEPSTVILLLTTLACLFIVRRR